MRDIRFEWRAEEKARRLSIAMCKQILEAVRASLDDPGSWTAGRYAIAKVPGWIVLADLDEDETGCVFALFTPNEWCDEQKRVKARVRRIVWCSQAATLRPGLSAPMAAEIESRVKADLDALSQTEVYINCVDVAGFIATCDLDEHGTASIFSLHSVEQYAALVEPSGIEVRTALLGPKVLISPDAYLQHERLSVH
jgi:hypothetical protein